MSKCRIIDRLAYTRGEVKFIGESEKSEPKESASNPEVAHRGAKCPECGEYSFFPEAGCWNCKSCGYSYCNAKR